MWCSPYNIEDGVGCAKWLCRCGCRFMDHLNTKLCYTYTSNGYCNCREFVFKSNENCTITCQFQHLMEISK